MSCFTIASARGLGRIFPEARFVHSVRDGRDSGSSKVSKRQKDHHPTDAASGIDWWEGRLRLAEGGVRGLDGGDGERLHAVCLDELVWGDREASLRGAPRRSSGSPTSPAMRAFFDEEMSAEAAHRERWREGPTEPEQEAIVAAYEAALDRIEREGFHCAELLRRSYERSAVAGADLSPPSSSSSAARAAAARTSSGGCWAATRGSPTSRSSRAFTATSAGCRTCWRGA